MSDRYGMEAMSDSVLIKLYSGLILDLASSIPLTDRLEAPDATVAKRSPLCGSNVVVDVILDGDRIAQYGQDVKACALGQTAASILGQNVIGMSRTEVAELRDAVRDMLTSDGPVPPAPFETFEVLQPAKSFRNRHDSILLALNATLEAMDAATAKSTCA